MTQDQWDELTKYGRHLDFNVKRLNETKDEIVKIQSMLQYLILSQSDDLKSTVNRLADRFGLLEQQLFTHGLPKIDYYDHEFSTMRKMAESDQWPQAVENIVRDENYQRAKAAAIIDMIIIEPIAGKKILDYGCGEGRLTTALKERGTNLAVGYDVKGLSEQRENGKVFTKDKLVVANNGPYDFIIVYDVLDHCEDPIGILKHIEELCVPHTKVFIRNHPFCSRHGKHMFMTMNKAFLHMFFDDIELVRLCGNSGEFTKPVLRPLFEYRAWLAQSNFNVELETASTTPIEQYFLKPENYLLRDKILARYENDDPSRHMQIDFVDYVLRKKSHVII